MGSAPELRTLLKQYFGFSSFRPLQEQIISDALQGRDVVALLPTGGGKSLCFQLPALALNGLTVVVSPLIALMKDQVDAMKSAGVAAGCLNSSLDRAEATATMRGLHQGEYRLLYVAPERLMLSGFLADLQRWNVKLLAVDEAHCISEWGHDFRPEYRQLAQFRESLKDVPIMALTATATTRVREDILRQLHLREPRCYVASFNRPNLAYRVIPKSAPYDQVLQFVRSRSRECGIIYCQSRKSVEAVAAHLFAEGIPARAYHAGLDASERSRNQELFLRDEVRVICATIAFGMGINKPNVRYVIHYDLPKNIESYYQETGRAGRDGLPGECLLLFNPGDVIKQKQFIEDKTDPKEQAIAREQLEQMVHYAESSQCRRASLLEYFGEEYPDPNCQGCDNCLSPRENYDGTIHAQKLLSCIYRIRELSGFSVGLGHVVEVLTGADTDKVRKWNHQKLSTYGIGKDKSRPEWQAIGRELARLGYVRQNPDRFNVLELTAEGVAFLKQKQTVMLTKPMAVPEKTRQQVGDIACDEELFESLRTLRKQLAAERAVPPYIIFSDVTLRQVGRLYPQTLQELGRIQGLGEKKLQEFGTVLLEAVQAHLATRPRQFFADDSFAAPKSAAAKPAFNGTAVTTLQMFRAGKSVPQIAKARGLSTGTIYTHLAQAFATGKEKDLDAFLTLEQQKEIAEAFEKAGLPHLGPVHELLKGKFEYGILKVFRAARFGTNPD
ncbi:MAG: recQ 1 [Verrucomicrobiales bacterium]|nr:recQ 1 [Verrucomicrobiales bacterium]